MKTRKKLSKLISSEMNKITPITDEKETLLINVLAMVQTLDKDYKLKDLARVIQYNFKEYGIFDELVNES